MSQSWWTKMGNMGKRRTSHRANDKSRRQGLGLESLEARQMLAVNPLMISEIMYHPPESPTTNVYAKDDFEFIEFYNAGETTLSMAGVSVVVRHPSSTDVMNFQIPAGSPATIAPGEFKLAVKNRAAFLDRYGPEADAKVVGTFNSGNLPNTDEIADAYNPPTVRLSTPGGINQNTLISFNYDDGTEFPSRPDGEGSSLEINELSTILDAVFYDDGDNWHSSDEYLGSPGYFGIGDHDGRLVINELMSNTNLPLTDRIEIYNPTDVAVDLTGWSITDNSGDAATLLGVYNFPAGTILRSGQYLVLDESHFNVGANLFSLNDTGDELYLISREADGSRLFEDIVRFGGVLVDKSIGRFPNGTGDFLPLTAPSFGSANLSNEISSVIISEIVYRHSSNNNDLRFIEIHNRSLSNVQLAQSTTRRWKLSGADFVFPVGTVINAGESIVVVGFNPATELQKVNTFRSVYGISASVRLFGGWTSNLSANGEELILTRPEVDGTTIYDVLADVVNFDSESPWPEGPNGAFRSTPYSLTRTSTTNVGNNPHSWRGATPSPGSLTLPATTSPMDGLVISEVVYFPMAELQVGTGTPLPTNHYEFIEIYNPTATPKVIADATISQGVNLTIRLPLNAPALQPGERLVFVSFTPGSSPLEVEFFNRYQLSSAEVRLHGPWTGSLSNGGEGIGLVDPAGNTIAEFEYNDRGDWPDRAAGLGSSLELIFPTPPAPPIPTGVVAASAYLNNPFNWRHSNEFYGTPGSAGTGPQPPTILINEVNTHTDFPFTDAIELYNAGATSVDLTDWILTDDVENPNNWFRLDPVTLNPGEYVTIDSSMWGNAFSLSGAEGEDLFLVERSGGANVRFVQDVEVPATFSDVTLGRWPNVNSSAEFFPMVSRTLSQYNTPPTIPLPGTVYSNGANSGPAFNDVVVSEVMYNPGGANPNDFEYIELFNRTGISYNLGPIESSSGWPDPAEGWRIRGSADFDFTSAHSIPANGTLLVVGFNPAIEPAKLTAFKNRYGLQASSVPIVGPFIDYVPLPDDGGRIELERPDAAQTVLPINERFTPNVLVDRVIYDDTAPWPTGPDGTGQSLQRSSATAFGDLAASWTGAAPAPGSFTPPTVNAPAVANVIVGGSGWSASFKNAITTAGSPVQGYTIPKGASQTSSLPWMGINTISITFDRDVMIASNALTLKGAATANYTVSSAATPNGDSTYTWTVSTPITRDKLNIHLDPTKITTAGTQLDGEWTDGSSNALSGNGSAGGEFVFRVNVLPGDVDRDGTVEASDMQSVRMGQFSAPGTPSYQTVWDINGNGAVNFIDLIHARNNVGDTLPPGTPGSPEAPASVIASAGRSSRGSAASRSAVAASRPGRVAAVDDVLSSSLEDDMGLSATGLRSRRSPRGR